MINVKTLCLVIGCLLCSLAAQATPLAAVVKGDTPLISAARLGKNNVVQQLLTQEGININATNELGHTALHVATKHNKESTIKMLVKAGIDIDITDKAGNTALDYAIEQNAVNSALAIDAGAVTVEVTEAGLPLVVASGGGLSSTTILTSLGVAAAGGGVAAAAGGGGSGDAAASAAPNNDEDNNQEDNSQSDGGQESGDDTSSGGQDTPARNTFFNFSGSIPALQAPTLAQINAQNVTVTGAGTKIAVIDTGLFFDHPDIVADPGISRDFVDGGEDATPIGSSLSNAHGTWVTGVISATNDNGFGIDGLAPGAELVAIKAADENGTLLVGNIVQALNYAVNDQAVNIINNSWGAPLDVTDFDSWDEVLTSSEYNAYKNTVQNNTIVVFAAGNSGFNNVTPRSGLPLIADAADRDAFEKLWVTVVAVDGDNNIVDNFTVGGGASNRCGAAAAFCIAAPGDFIYTTGDPNIALQITNHPDSNSDTVFSPGYIALSGTSFAAPHVSAALSLLLETFPSFMANPQAAVERIFDTAQKRPGQEEIYGQGILDVGAALAPEGSTSAVIGDTKSGATVEVASSIITTNAAFGDAISSSGLRFGALDEINRFYSFAVNDTATHQPELAKRMFDFGRQLYDSSVTLTEQLQLSVRVPANNIVDGQFDTRHIDDVARMIEGDLDDDYINFRGSLAFESDNHAIQAIMNAPVDKEYGFAAFNTQDGLMQNAALTGNAFLGLAGDDNVALINELSLNNDIQVSSVNFISSADDETTHGASTGFLLGVSAKLSQDIGLGIDVGHMVEQSTFLGTGAGGAFAIGEGTPTWFVGLSGSYEVTKEDKIVFQYTSGTSKPSPGKLSLWNDFSDIRSESFALGFLHQDKETSWGLVVAQPLRVTSGSANIRVATHTDVDENIYYSTRALDLTPSGQEIDLEGFYRANLGEDMFIQTSAMLRHQPNHVANADSELIMMTRFGYQF